MHPFISNLNISRAPWKVRTTGRSFEVINEDKTTIARVPRYPWDEPGRAESNAALLAAAPELLAALKEAAFILESRGEPLGERFFELINRASPAVPPIPYPRPRR